MNFPLQSVSKTPKMLYYKQGKISIKGVYYIMSYKKLKGNRLKTKLRVVPLFILLNIFFFSFLLSATAATGIINTNYVNIRSGPATTYNIVGRLD